MGLELNNKPVNNNLFVKRGNKGRLMLCYKEGTQIFSIPFNRGLATKGGEKTVEDLLNIGIKGNLDVNAERNINFGTSTSTPLSLAVGKMLDSGAFKTLKVNGTNFTVDEEGAVDISNGKLTIDKNGSLITEGYAEFNAPLGGSSEHGVRIKNDGYGYCRFLMEGANPELHIGGDTDTPTTAFAGSTKIYLWSGAADGEGSGNLAQISFRQDDGADGNVANSSYSFGTGGSPRELRLAHGGDLRTAANACIRIDTDGNIGFNAQAPAAPPDYTAATYSTNRSITGSTSAADTTDVLATLIADLIAIGLLQ